MATVRKPSKRPDSAAAQPASAPYVEPTAKYMPKPCTSAASQGPYAEGTSACMRLQRRAEKETIDMCTSYQAGLHKISQDIQDAWNTVFNCDDNQASIRISWTSCWGRLQGTLLAVFHDALSESSSPDSMPGLSKESWKNLTNVLGALKAKVIHHHTETELHNQSAQLLGCFEELMQATSDMSTWHRLLDDLIMDTNDDPACRNAKADLIQVKLDGANQALREIAKRAQQLVVPV